MKPLHICLGGAGLLAGYALAEPFLWRLRTITVPVAPDGPTLDLLHLSDTHLGAMAGPRGPALVGWLRRVPEDLGIEPDLIVATGDLTEGSSGIEQLLEAVTPWRARLGAFYVLGSHDYFEPRFSGYLKYFTGRRPGPQRRADTPRLERGLKELGWTSLTNATELIEAGGSSIRLAGVDDPYLGWHSTHHIQRAADDRFAIGVMHAPDLVSEFALAGFDLSLAGHTHGGGVRFPGIGALITNSSLPSDLAMGLHRVGGMWLHVSPGLGTGPYAPIRFLARPELTLLRIRPRPF